MTPCCAMVRLLVELSHLLDFVDTDLLILYLFPYLPTFLPSLVVWAYYEYLTTFWWFHVILQHQYSIEQSQCNRCLCLSMYVFQTKFQLKLTHTDFVCFSLLAFFFCYCYCWVCWACFLFNNVGVCSVVFMIWTQIHSGKGVVTVWQLQWECATLFLYYHYQCQGMD